MWLGAAYARTVLNADRALATPTAKIARTTIAIRDFKRADIAHLSEIT
jgi:hypothetical protein